MNFGTTKNNLLTDQLNSLIFQKKKNGLLIKCSVFK